MRKIKWASLFLAFLLVLGLIGCSNKSTTSNENGSNGGAEETVKLGVVLATTGPIATTGTWALDGHKMAVKQINENGGVKIGEKNYKIEIVHYDSEGRAESATSATERLINQDKVPVIIGTSISSETAAMIPIAERAQTPLITFVAASDILTSQGANFFTQAAPANKNYVQAGTKTLKDMGIEKVAMIYVDDAWGQSYAKLYPPVLKEQGVELITQEKFAPEQKEFMTLLNKIKSKNPDGILLAAETELAIPLLKQLEDVMPDVKVMESGGTIPEEVVKLAPDAAEGLVTLSRAGEETAEIKEFKELFESQFKYEANSFTFSGWDGIHLVVDAMQRAGTVSDTQAINKAIRESSFDGLIGTYTFTENGENRLVGNRAVIKDGTVIYQGVGSSLPQ